MADVEPVPTVKSVVSFCTRHCSLLRSTTFYVSKVNRLLVDRKLFYLFLFDLLLGLAVFTVFPDEKPIAEELSFQFNKFVHWLQSLIVWLMGNPAGLKLNKPLNTMLGQFFLYHIYLWETYITFLRPALLYTLNALRYLGLLGLSWQIALLSDAFSVLTVHIFCFHIYAARLYQLQMAALISLGRLFRGKKYNPLRKRVDSIEYDTQQLFLGTLLFTVLLFLLPTIGVYYVVFAGLRFVVVFTQKTLGMAVWLERWLVASIMHIESLETPFAFPDALKVWQTIKQAILGVVF